jgi:hypothetical protein
VLLGVEGCKVSKKTEKLIKSRKLKKSNREKKLIKPIRILKKTDRFGSVRFQFYRHETEKTEPNPNQKKLKKKPNQIEPNKKNQVKPETETGLVFFQFFSVLVRFQFYKP